MKYISKNSWHYRVNKFLEEFGLIDVTVSSTLPGYIVLSITNIFLFAAIAVMAFFFLAAFPMIIGLMIFGKIGGIVAFALCMILFVLLIIELMSENKNIVFKDDN